MNPHLIKKLLLSKTRPGQLWLSVIGSGIGLCIMMLGVQLWVDVRSLMQEKEMLGRDYVVISKKITLLHSLSGAPRFSDLEIQELMALKSVDDIGNFTPSRFKASMSMNAQMGSMGGQLFKSDLFFESVPNRFVDIEADAWQWQPGDPQVPVIVPSEFIKQYNHAFASGQNMPVIPENLLKSLRFELLLSGNEKSDRYRGVIAGFSNRIQAILVPEPFMQYANSRYAPGGEAAPSRLILHAENPASPELLNHLKEKQIETAEDKVKEGKTRLLLEVVMLLLALLGAFIVALSMMGFLQYNQLLAYRSAYEIQTLHRLGYTHGNMVLPYFRFALRNLGIALALATGLFAALEAGIVGLFSQSGFNLPLHGWPWSLLCAFLAVMLMGWLCYRSIKNQVGRLAN
jgi:hypothetical protein